MSAVETTAKADSAIVTIANVSKLFGDLKALNNVSLSIEPGTVQCIIGPSGSGKSTLLRCINQLEKIDQGAIRVDGELIGYRRVGDELHELTDPEIARQRLVTGMVFQRFNLFNHMTALQNIIEGPLTVLKRPRKEIVAEATALLERVGLAEKRDSYPSELSGGQQQRIAIARALAADPDLLVCDEAVSALDAQHRAGILALLEGLKRQRRLALLFITHDMGAARALAERIAVMHQGEVVEQGPMAAVLSDPRHPATRALLADRPATRPA